MKEEYNMKINFGINFRRDLVEFFPYRTAIIKGGMVDITPDYQEYLKILNKACRVAGVKPDNHICFRTTSNAIMFSDGCISIAKPEALVVGNW